MVDDSEWVNDLKKIKEDSSFISIYTHLWENVPRMYDVVGSMEARLEECSVLLQNHATKIFEWDTIISKTGKPYFYMSNFYMSKVKLYFYTVLCVCVYVCVCLSLSPCAFSKKKEILWYKISKNIKINLFYFKTSLF